MKFRPITVETGRLEDQTVIRRFHAKVSKPDGEQGCWEWQGYRCPKGYGYFYPTGNYRVPAHRWAYSLLVGPIPERLQLDHLCRNRCCANPAHLEPVDNRENQRRGEHLLSGRSVRENVCPRGHSLADAYVGKKQRVCKPCHRARVAAYRQRVRARTTGVAA